MKSGNISLDPCVREICKTAWIFIREAGECEVVEVWKIDSARDRSTCSTIVKSNPNILLMKTRSNQSSNGCDAAKVALVRSACISQVSLIYRVLRKVRRQSYIFDIDNLSPAVRYFFDAALEFLVFLFKEGWEYTRFFNKKHFYKNMNPKNPKTLRKC